MHSPHKPQYSFRFRVKQWFLPGWPSGRGKSHAVLTWGLRAGNNHR